MFGIDDVLGGVIGLGLGAAGSVIGKGGKVQIPEFHPVDANAVQSDTINANIANFDKATTLSSRVNDYNFDQLHSYLSRSIPGYDDMIKSQASTIASGLKGQIPQDVADAIAQRSASRAISGGFGDSGMARNLTARDLGLTSYDITNKALDQATRLVSNIRATAVPDLTSPASMFLSPSQRLNAAIGQNTEGYNSRVMAAQANAMPDPTLASIGNFAGGLGGLMFRGSAGGIFGSNGSVAYQPPSAGVPDLLSGTGSMPSDSSFGGWH